MGVKRRKWKTVGFCILILSFIGILTSVVQLWSSSPNDAVVNNDHYKEAKTINEDEGQIMETTRSSFPTNSTHRRAQHGILQAEIEAAEPILNNRWKDNTFLKSYPSNVEHAGNAAEGLNQIFSNSEPLHSYHNDNHVDRNKSNFDNILHEPLQNNNGNISVRVESGGFKIENLTESFGEFVQGVEVRKSARNFLETFAEVSGNIERDIDRNDFAGFQNNLNVALPIKASETAHNKSLDSEFISADKVPPGMDLPGGGQVMIVSMSLYGSDPRYTIGIIRNAQLVKENFPGWKLRVYMESPLSATRFGRVPPAIITSLKGLGVDIQYVVPEQDFIPPMMWRFLVADDPSVDYFVIRDSDSRLTERDAAAVTAWIESGRPFHSIRDHPSHASYAVSGGLWGGKARELRNILRRSWIDLMRGTSSEYLEDMNFLNKVIWPKVQEHAYCSDSVSCDRWPNSHPFPVQRYGYDHVGQVFDERDIGRPIDIRILQNAGENPRCSNITVL